MPTCSRTTRERERRRAAHQAAGRTRRQEQLAAACGERVSRGCADPPRPVCASRFQRGREKRRARRWKLEVATVFRLYAGFYRRVRAPLLRRYQQRDRALREIEACCTSVLGGHLLACDDCGHQEYAWNACRNRNCPKCTGYKRRQWYAARRREVLPVEYHHLVFTIPSQLADLAEYNDVLIYDILFQSAAEALLYVGEHWSELGAWLGFNAILHTWGSSFMQLHPHLHILVPAGGLSLDGTRWVAMPAGSKFPEEMLREEFRRRFVKKLRRTYRKDQLTFSGRTGHLENPRVFEQLMQRMETCYWNLHDRLVVPESEGETAQAAAERVVAYLARYVHRVAISNDRLMGIENDEVLFWYHDKRDGGKKKIARLPALEFIDSFLQHVLPRGKRHVRNYGYLSPGQRVESLKTLATLFDLNATEEDEKKKEKGDEPRPEKDERAERICPCCEVGVMVSVQKFPRPTVHQIMQMTLDQLRQPEFPFTRREHEP